MMSPNNKANKLIEKSNASMKKLSRRGTRRSSDERMRELEISGLVSEKNVLITGGASGLGFAFFNHFLQFGANKIVIIDVDEVAGKRIVSSIEKTHGSGKVYFLRADTSKNEEISAAFEQAVKLTVQPIDIVINNAGILDERRWEREITVNLTGAVSVAMLAMDHMSKEKGGKGGILVNVAEHCDVKFTAQLPVYNATKQAIIGLSQSLAAPCNTERTGVRVITLCPGLTETALTIESPNKLLTRVMKADFVKSLEQLTIQTPYVVAQGLMWILRMGESGSIWVVENGQSPYEVSIPHCRSLRRLYKNNFVVDESAIRIVSKGRPIREVCDNTRTGLMSCAS